MSHSVNEFQNSNLARTSPRSALPMIAITTVLICTCMYLAIRCI